MHIFTSFYFYYVYLMVVLVSCKKKNIKHKVAQSVGLEKKRS